VSDRNPSKPHEGKFSERLIEFIVTPFYRLNIARKLMLGYCVLLLLLVGISIFALFNLNRINEINSSMLDTDLPIINISGKMVDIILAQEFYVQRYLILKSPEVLKEFWNKEKEFNQLT
jgi:CHASE3 domain sensor protein